MLCFQSPMASLKGTDLASLCFFRFHFVTLSSPRASKPFLHPASMRVRAFLYEATKKIGASSLSGRLISARTVALPSSSENGETSAEDKGRPPFDINLAVVLAGFAFEAYSSPPEDVGWREVDAAGCQTVFLSELFLREIYDGQLFVKLEKGVDFPAMDPWGTCDPYVVLQLEGQVAKSKIKWATKEPTWNENFNLNVKVTPGKSLQVAAWDANLVAAHKRMGNASVDIQSLCDGDLHELVINLEGIGGGGKVFLEVRYRSYDEIEKDIQWWRIPFVSDFLTKSNLGNALRMVLGSESVNVSQFVQSAFGQLKALNYAYLQKLSLPDSMTDDSQCPDDCTSAFDGSENVPDVVRGAESSMHDSSSEKEDNLSVVSSEDCRNINSLEPKDEKHNPPDEYFWRTFADIVNQSIVQKLGFSIPEIKMWDGFDVLNKLSLQSRRLAEQKYIESGLVTPENQDGIEKFESSSTNESKYSPLDIKKVSRDVLSQTETVFGALLILTATFSNQRKVLPLLTDDKSKKDASATGVLSDDKGYAFGKSGAVAQEQMPLDTQKSEDMRKLFSSAESAMEAWAMLATSLGCTSFIKSDFQKICFLDNISTDTQVAIWRDSLRKRLIVAFRGTEQVKWKDLCTDLMLLPAGLNPERLGGEFKEEVQVHSGFLNAYDSVKIRIMMLIKFAIGSYRPHINDSEDDRNIMDKWHVYVTGHSLGGALATLLALELSTSQMVKNDIIDLTMYNFGSPRVGNRKFADFYNEKVKDSWRIVNHRDIIPTIPRLMGYCHIAQPVYLAAGNLEALVNNEVSGDGYQGDVIGETTPDVLLSEFMEGEKQLVEQIIQTEINLLLSLRDGTALMQHMEDFYYITLLESARSYYRQVDTSNESEQGYISTA